jgi:hypothetical protein
LELTFHVAVLEEIKRWVLNFGPEMAALEAESLVEMIRADLSRSLETYFQRENPASVHYSTGPGAIVS